MFCFQPKREMTQATWDNPKWNTTRVTWDGESITLVKHMTSYLTILICKLAQWKDFIKVE